MRTRMTETRVTGTAINLEELAKVVGSKEGAPENAQVSFWVQTYEGGRHLIEGSDLMYTVTWTTREDVAE